MQYSTSKQNRLSRECREIIDGMGNRRSRTRSYSLECDERRKGIGNSRKSVQYKIDVEKHHSINDEHRNRKYSRSPMNRHRSSLAAGYSNKDSRRQRYKVYSYSSRPATRSRITSSSYQGKGETRNPRKEEHGHPTAMMDSKDSKVGDKRGYRSKKSTGRSNTQNSRSDSRSLKNRNRRSTSGTTCGRRNSRERRYSSSKQNGLSRERREINDGIGNRRSRARSYSSERDDRRKGIGNSRKSVQNKINDERNSQIEDGEPNGGTPVNAGNCEEIVLESPSTGIISVHPRPPLYVPRLLPRMAFLVRRAPPPIYYTFSPSYYPPPMARFCLRPPFPPRMMMNMQYRYP